MNTVKCPTCKKIVTWDNENPWRPFCSERCKLIDLGEWAAESHRITGETADHYTVQNQGEKESH
ncbi:MAG: DNA gyrase inhibitor YacG [Gammaproteobacteria bacterium]|nr:DNA gyrase inhibitor YacG [Gammaproteobacteria bacterium]